MYYILKFYTPIEYNIVYIQIFHSDFYSNFDIKILKFQKIREKIQATCSPGNT
jgi:hypothetical protein